MLELQSNKTLCCSSLDGWLATSTSVSFHSNLSSTLPFLLFPTDVYILVTFEVENSSPLVVA